ncbi:2-phosphosulfolactate phosphatase [Paenibacillus sp. TRM 82003]|nr:2-phosphosulfolactate phosphatase [Paenibacillus sp. TRM 82003]
MRIDCIANISETHTREIAGKTALVVDVLRAASAMTTALANGAASIAPVGTVAQAKESAKEGDLLAGERGGRQIPGFALGNSPLDFPPETVAGRRIVMTTTNGTRAVQKAAKAAAVLVACFLNAAAVARAALQYNRDIVLMLSGTHDVFALEDGLCAGMIIREIRTMHEEEIAVNDLGFALEGAYLALSERLESSLLACENGQRLTNAGMEAEVKFCAARNRFAIVPALCDGELRPFEFRQACSKTIHRS